MNNNDISITIICDNGGGVTVQAVTPTARYQASQFPSIRDAANLIADLDRADPSDLAGWAWDWPDDWTSPTEDQVRNGGYRVYSFADFLALPPCERDWGSNVRALRRALGSALTA